MIIRQGSRTFQPGDLATKAPEAVLTFVFDWSEDLGDGLTIVDTSFDVVTIKPSTDSALELSDIGLAYGDVEALATVGGGQLGALYEIRNSIVTNESPAETKVCTFRLLIEH